MIEHPAQSVGKISQPSRHSGIIHTCGTHRRSDHAYPRQYRSLPQQRWNPAAPSPRFPPIRICIGALSSGTGSAASSRRENASAPQPFPHPDIPAGRGSDSPQQYTPYGAGSPPALPRHTHRERKHHKQQRRHLPCCHHQTFSHFFRVCPTKSLFNSAARTGSWLICTGTCVYRSLLFTRPSSVITTAIKTLFIYPQQVKAGNGKLSPPRRQRIHRILRKMRNHLPGPGQNPIQFLQLHLQGPVDALRFLRRQLLAFHQFVDVKPVALRRRDAPGRSVRLFPDSPALPVQPSHCGW